MLRAFRSRIGFMRLIRAAGLISQSRSFFLVLSHGQQAIVIGTKHKRVEELELFGAQPVPNYQICVFFTELNEVLRFDHRPVYLADLYDGRL
jgi:hypothetical protein